MSTMTATDVHPVALTWAPKGEARALISASVPLDKMLAAQQEYLVNYYYASAEVLGGLELCGPMKDTLRFLSFRHRNRGESMKPPALANLVITGRCWREISGGLLIRMGPRGSAHGQFALLTETIPVRGKTLTLIDKP